MLRCDDSNGGEKKGREREREIWTGGRTSFPPVGIWREKTGAASAA